MRLTMIPHVRFPFTGSFPVTFPFGASPIDSDMQKKFDEWGVKGHNGVDFGLPEGTEVLAVDNGTITQFGENGDFGISVTVKHEWGTSLYAHMRDTTVTLYQNIKEGEVIGHSGQTGYVTSPHLHFGIKPTDPDTSNGYLGFVDPTPNFSEEKTESVAMQETPVKVVEKEVAGEVPTEKIVEKVITREPTREELEKKSQEILRARLVKARQSKATLRQHSLEQILAYMQGHGEVTNKELRPLFPKLSESTITNYLNVLEHEGKIRQKGIRGRSVYTLVH